MGIRNFVQGASIPCKDLLFTHKQTVIPHVIVCHVLVWYKKEVYSFLCRVIYPNKRDYTYSPFGQVRLNRSRLDFFVISSNLISNISDCIIADSVSCKLFDHKPVCLKLNQPTSLTKPTCRLINLFLESELLSLSVEIAVRRVHLYSLRCDNANQNNIMLKDRELAKIRDALTTYRNLTTILGNIASQGGDALANLNVAAMEQDVRTKLEDMSPLTIFEQANKNCNDADFFIALTNEVRNAGART
jgi:hypothetical protein